MQWGRTGTLFVLSPTPGSGPIPDFFTREAMAASASKREFQPTPRDLIQQQGSGNYPKLLGARMYHITKSGRTAVVRAVSAHCMCCSVTTQSLNRDLPVALENVIKKTIPVWKLLHRA